MINYTAFNLFRLGLKEQVKHYNFMKNTVHCFKFLSKYMYIYIAYINIQIIDIIIFILNSVIYLFHICRSHFVCVCRPRNWLETLIDLKISALCFSKYKEFHL